jgi:hypothetical protein
MTRQFLRTFGTATEMKRDQLQKFLRGTITTPDDFEQRGWCRRRRRSSPALIRWISPAIGKASTSASSPPISIRRWC